MLPHKKRQPACQFLPHKEKFKHARASERELVICRYETIFRLGIRGQHLMDSRRYTSLRTSCLALLGGENTGFESRWVTISTAKRLNLSGKSHFAATFRPTLFPVLG